MTDRMPTLLRAILSLKAVLDNENIFHKMDSYSKKRKKKINILGGKNRSLWKIFSLDLSSKPENR